MQDPSADSGFLPSHFARDGYFYFALAMALVLHAIIIFVPFHKQKTLVGATPAWLSVRLLVPPVQVQIEIAETVNSEPQALPLVQSVSPVKPEPLVADLAGQKAEQMENIEFERVRRSVLASQFLSVERKSGARFSFRTSEADPEPIPDFSFPHRGSMHEIMTPPLPDLPFAYTPGFVEFSYDPGFRGELQRFWDVITPEFEFKTKNGTRVQCALFLIIAGCAWD